MEITKTYNWNRRDFDFDAKCEACGFTTTGCSGYDDQNYYSNIIPNWKCNGCGKCSVDIGEVKVITPRYDANVTM